MPVRTSSGPAIVATTFTRSVRCVFAKPPTPLTMSPSIPFGVASRRPAAASHDPNRPANPTAVTTTVLVLVVPALEGALEVK